MEITTQKAPGRWFYITMTVILLVPLLHFYSARVETRGIENIAGELEEASANYNLFNNISALTYNAQAYMLYADKGKIEKFNELSINVVKKELDLFNRGGSEKRKADLKNLIEKTRDYISYVRGEVLPAVQAGKKDEFIAVNGGQFDAMTGEMLELSGSLLLTGDARLKDETTRVANIQNRISILSLGLVLMILLLLLLGVRKLLHPLLESGKLSADLVAFYRDGVMVIDRESRVTRVNEPLQKLLNVKQPDILGKTLNELSAAFPFIQNLIQPLFSVLLNQDKIINKQIILNSAGSKSFLNVDYHPMFFSKRLTGAVLIVNTVEMQKNKRYLFDTIEAERKKISIEIHDWIGRGMSPIIHSLDYILRANNEVPPGIHESLVKLRTHCQNAAMDMRSIMNDIHPYLIDEVGLVSALESYTSNFENMQGIRVYMFYKERTLNINKKVEIIIYRIIQEALSNVVKHSTAGEVDIYLKEEEDVLKVEIMDNGDMMEDFVAGKGLWGMKERANLAGGDLSYGSDENGFSLTLTIPLSSGGKNNG
ncbi:sensor protein DegS [Desulfocucumis palustris]|uniref:histidine kinase n=1 Tax=Desulfocucumis palustris TaxID=1898651 RepID=A0A2L2XHE1_9FIRM|nr:ATP-binding protein [Desulfocucumis palustris]GBF33291.1 sensor protein DegS [Desulfocucumis palustris]